MRDYEKAVQAMKRLMKPDYSEYEKALKALGWLNRNTDYRANNVSEDFPQSYKERVGGMFVLSKLSIMDSIDFRTGKELIKIAEWEGWKNE